MNARCHLILPLLLALRAGGAESAAVADFSDGFAKLAALGMPALDAGAKWTAGPESGGMSYEIRELAKSLKGNAWLLPAEEGKIRLLPMGGVEVTETGPAKSDGASGGLVARTLGGRAGANRPPTVFPEPAKDVEKLIYAIDKRVEKERRENRSYWSMRSDLGDLLLFATQLHQTGHGDLANRLALSTFGLFPSREAAVDAALDRIAEHEYRKAADGFFKTGDWKAYHRALEDLVGRFPRGWMARDAVRMFLPQVAKQAQGAVAAAPSLPGIPLDPEALKIAAELTRPPTAPDKEQPTERQMPPEILYQMQMMGSMDGYYGQTPFPPPLWLIDPSKPEKDAPAIMRLAGLKMAALPALAALAADPFLTHIPNPDSRSGYYSSDESDAERTLRIYTGMFRPASRGEIAKRMLAATLPDPQGDLDEADPETLGALAISFWKEHANASAGELAAVFLSDGSENQMRQAATILASSKDPKAREVFEKHVLASGNALAFFQPVQVHLRTRRAAGKPFLDAYAKLVRSQVPESVDGEPHDQASWMIKQAGGVDKLLKQLDGLVTTQSPRSLAVQIAKGKSEDAEAGMRSLSVLLAEASPKKRLYAFLEGANAASDPSIRARFLELAQRIGWDSETEDEMPADREIPDAEAQVWRKLMADERPIPDGTTGLTRKESSSLGDLAARALEYSVSPVSSYRAMEAAPILDQPLAEIFRERAEARLSGKPVPPLPDASRISPKRLAEIVAAAGERDPLEIHPFLKTLTDDERAAWAAWAHKSGHPPDAQEREGSAFSRHRTYGEIPHGSVGYRGRGGHRDRLRPVSSQSHDARPTSGVRSKQVFPQRFLPGKRPIRSRPAVRIDFRPGSGRGL